MKVRLSTSEAALKSCCCKYIQSGVLQSIKAALERDLAQSKVATDNFRHFNNSLTTMNSFLTTEVEGLKKEVAQNQERLCRYITSNHRIPSTLHNFVSKSDEGGDEIEFQSLSAVQNEVRRFMDTSLSLSDREADAALLSQLSTLQKEKRHLVSLESSGSGSSRGRRMVF